MLLRTTVAYDVLSRSQNTAASFAQATKFVVQAMTESMAKKYETELFYGQSNIGVIDVVDNAGAAGSDSITVTAAEWASGIFCGGKDMKIDIYNPTETTLRQTVTIKSIDFDLRKIVLNEDLAVGVVSGDIIKPHGSTGKQAAGLVKIMSNTGSLFDIDAASYELWKGNVVTSVGELTFEKLNKHLAKAIEKGLDKDVVAIVSPKTWASLMKDLAALRRLDSSYSSKKLENGAMAIEFYSQSGKIEVHSSHYCKDGYGFVFAPEDFARIGSTDITFSLPGMPEQFLSQSPSNAGYELRAYVNSGLFSKSPGKTLLLTGITHA